MSDLPTYVSRGGQQCFRQPLVLQDVRFTGFVMDADADALQATLDRYLNGPLGDSPYRYHPLVPRVMYAVAQAGRAHSQDPPDRDMGCMHEVDVALWVPAVRTKTVGSTTVVEKMAWFLPYVFVNNTWAVVSGREIYGFPKEQGEFVVPTKPDDPPVYRASTLVLPKFSPTTPPTMLPVLEAHPVPGAPIVSPGKADWDDLKEAVLAVLALFVQGGTLQVPGLGEIRELYDLLVHHEVPLVFLKQFRDVSDGTRACYQEVVESPFSVTRFGGAGNLHTEFEVAVSDYDSHPILRELGLKPRNEVHAAWWAEFDMVAGLGGPVS